MRLGGCAAVARTRPCSIRRSGRCWPAIVLPRSTLSYDVYDERPLCEADAWGDLASFREAAAAS